MKAMFLIDDSVENALACSRAEPPVPVLLFGDYEWNKRESVIREPKDEMSFRQRLEFEEGREWWKYESVELPDCIRRARDWSEVVEWTRENCSRP